MMWCVWLSHSWLPNTLFTLWYSISSRNAQLTQDHLVFWSWTTHGSIMAMRYLSLLIGLVRGPWLWPIVTNNLKSNLLADVKIEYLPPYSPDFNPIKQAFSKIKHFLRRHQEYYLSTADDGILWDMYEIMEIITPEDAEGYYGESGYIWDWFS